MGASVPHETEVLALLVSSALNRRIGETVTSSERTARTDVSTTLFKLELMSPAQFALWPVCEICVRHTRNRLRPAAPDQLDSRASTVTEALIVNAASLSVILNSDLGRHRKIGPPRTVRTLLVEAEIISLYRARKGGDVSVGGPNAYLQRSILLLDIWTTRTIMTDRW